MPSSTPDPDEIPEFADVLAPEAVQFLAARGVRRGLTSAFQSLLVASVEAVAEVASPVRDAAAAAINLAQQTHVAAVARDLDAVTEALRGGLSEQGQALLDGTPRRGDALRALLKPEGGWRPRLRPKPEPAPLSWGVAMTVATDALARAAEHTAMLAAQQPDHSSARILGENIAARLERDRDLLIEEAARTGE